MQDELLGLLAAREGHFRLESGHHGSLWLDLDRLLMGAKAVRRVALALAARLAPYGIDAVCGPLVGGALIAQSVAAELDVELYYTERFLPQQKDNSLYAAEYRIPGTLHRYLHGKKVAVVDDVISAGSAMRGTMMALQAHEARTVVAGALLVLGATAPEYLRGQDIPLESIGSLSGDLWAPDACPLCAARIPLEDLTAGRVAN